MQITFVILSIRDFLKHVKGNQKIFVQHFQLQAAAVTDFSMMKTGISVTVKFGCRLLVENNDINLFYVVVCKISAALSANPRILPH